MYKIYGHQAGDYARYCWAAGGYLVKQANNEWLLDMGGMDYPSTNKYDKNKLTVIEVETVPVANDDWWWPVGDRIIMNSGAPGHIESFSEDATDMMVRMASGELVEVSTLALTWDLYDGLWRTLG